jgi:hypothetical protein
MRPEGLAAPQRPTLMGLSGDVRSPLGPGLGASLRKGLEVVAAALR